MGSSFSMQLGFVHYLCTMVAGVWRCDPNLASQYQRRLPEDVPAALVLLALVLTLGYLAVDWFGRWWEKGRHRVGPS
jgi:hypothetical protein